MAIRIEIPLEKKRIQSIPVKFSEKCVVCGKPAEVTRENIVTRKYSIQLPKQEKSIEISNELQPFNIPYCEEHNSELESKLDKSGKISFTILAGLFTVISALMLIFFFTPLNSYFISTAVDELGRFFGTFAAGTISVLIILFLPSLFITAAVGWLANALVMSFIKPLIGLKIEAHAGNVYFYFNNDDIGREFMALNEELGARIFNIKQTFQEEMEQHR